MTPDIDDTILRIFNEEVPEIANGLIEIKAVARLPGIRSKVAINGRAENIDAMSVCVGVNGCILHRIIDRLQGERIELVKWEDIPEKLIANALQPARIDGVLLDPNLRKAMVIVSAEQIALVEGIRGNQNLELARRLSGWHITAVTDKPKENHF
jgi:transcription termination/antitermination protein NusA